jgi:hypothetical protein
MRARAQFPELGDACASQAGAHLEPQATQRAGACSDAFWRDGHIVLHSVGSGLFRLHRNLSNLLLSAQRHGEFLLAL